jgi:hypothetical protein
MALVALHAVESAAMDRHDGSLNINEIVLTQLFLNPFNQRLCHIRAWFRKLNYGWEGSHGRGRDGWAE